MSYGNDNKWNSFSSIHITLFVYQHLTNKTLILRRIKFMDKRKLNIATPTDLPLWGLVLLSCPQSIPWVQGSTFVSAQHFLPVETETRSTIIKLFRDSFNSWREVLWLLSLNFPLVNITGFWILSLSEIGVQWPKNKNSQNLKLVFVKSYEINSTTQKISQRGFIWMVTP